MRGTNTLATNYQTRKTSASAKIETIARRQTRARKAGRTVSKAGRTVVLNKRKGF